MGLCTFKQQHEQLHSNNNRLTKKEFLFFHIENPKENPHESKMTLNKDKHKKIKRKIVLNPLNADSYSRHLMAPLGVNK